MDWTEYFPVSAETHFKPKPISLSAPLSAILVINFATLAGIVFRPDNNVVMKLFQPLLDMAGLRLNHRDKATYHTFFNGLVPIIAMGNVFLKKTLR